MKPSIRHFLLFYLLLLQTVIILLIVLGDYFFTGPAGRRISQEDLLILLLLYPLSAALIWIIVGRALRGVKRVTQDVSEREENNLKPLPLAKIPLELQPLMDELNKLLVRLKLAFDREQRFAADAAHELRTPLAALKTQAQVALKTTDPIERQKQLNNVIQVVDRCTHIIHQLLTLCRLNPDLPMEDQTKIDLRKLATEIVGQMVPLAIAKHIEISLHVKDTFYPVLGNPTGLHAMMRNLIDNAIRYSPDNAQVDIHLEKKAGKIIFRVLDTGPGIPEELRTRVFERFYRILKADSPSGSGLGMAIVLQNIRLHRGEIQLLTPSSGKGLEVKITLPML